MQRLSVLTIVTAAAILMPAIAVAQAAPGDEVPRHAIIENSDGLDLSLSQLFLNVHIINAQYIALSNSALDFGEKIIGEISLLAVLITGTKKYFSRFPPEATSPHGVLEAASIEKVRQLCLISL